MLTAKNSCAFRLSAWAVEQEDGCYLPHRSAISGAAQISCVLAVYPYGDHNDLPQESKKALQNPRTGLSKLHLAPGERKLFLQHAFAC